MENPDWNKINWNKIRKKFGLCKDDFPYNFNKKLKYLNNIIKKYYIPGVRKTKVIPKEEKIFEYNDNILELGESSVILKFTPFFEEKIEEFKRLNKEIKDIPKNDIWNNVCYGLLCGEILNNFGNKLKEFDFNTAVLWLRDSALIPIEKGRKAILVGESSETKNSMYKNMREFVNLNIRKGKEITHEMIKAHLNSKKIDEDIKNFYDFIYEKINGKTVFIDTGFSGLQQERTKIHLGLEDIKILLGSKEEPIKYAKDIGMKREEMYIVENMDKPIITFQKFNKVKDIITANCENIKTSDKNYIIENIIEDVDFTILQHIGFEMYQKEKINDRKIEKLFKEEII